MTDRIPPTGWVAEVDHPPSGTTHRLSILDDPSFVPGLNQRPTVSVPVPRRTDGQALWTDADFDAAPLRLWYDGQRQPIDTLRTPKPSPERVVLEGDGASALTKTVDVEYRATEATEAVRTLLSNNTPYTYNVDAPATDPETDVLVQNPTTSADFSNLLTNNDSETPLTVTNDTVEALQTCWTTEGENYDSGSDSGNGGLNNDYSDGVAATFGGNNGGDVTWTFTTDHDIPDGALSLGIRRNRESGSSGPDIEILLDGQSLGARNLGGINISWVTDLFDLSAFNRPGRLSAGTHDLRFRVSSSSSDLTAVDVVAPYDNRYSYFFDNDNGGNDGYLDGPELYPDAVDAIFDDATDIKSFTEGDLAVTIDDTSNGQALAMSNDFGRSYGLTASNTATLNGSFADAGPAIRARVTLSRYGSRTSATPQTGFKPQTLSDYELRATLEDVPVLVNTRYNDTLISVLQDIAEFGDFIFEIVYDEGAGTHRIEWTQPGQRTASTDRGLVDWSVKKDTDITTKATVVGGTQHRSEERFTANHGTAVALDEDHLVAGRESVYDPATGTLYDRETDYDLDLTAGEITTLASGALADGTEYGISYDYKPQATYSDPNHSGPEDATTVTIPGLSTDRACEQAAFRLVEDLKAPRWTAEADLAELPPDLSLVEELQIDALPEPTGSLEVLEREQGAAGAPLRLGTRETREQIVKRLRDRARQVAERA